MAKEPTAAEYEHLVDANWKAELIRKYEAGEYLTKIDAREARKLIKERDACKIA